MGCLEVEKRKISQYSKTENTLILWKMGLILAKLWSFFGNEEHKICIVGLDNAGKTTILYQFLMNEVVHTSPTIGSNVEEVVWKNVHFIMWDLGGQESLSSMEHLLLKYRICDFGGGFHRP